MIRIGIICPSEIALRRFMPALQKAEGFAFAGIASCTAEERYGVRESYTEREQEIIENDFKKAEVFIEQYGGKLYSSYAEICESDEIDAIYVPLPPALHFRWAKYALEHGKHVFVEKPSTLYAADSRELVELAEKNGLAIHENYMFAFHKQLEEISRMITRGDIGNVRLYRVSFGFPRRAAGDFRYIKALGGGALNDCGGYTLKYADMLLGKQGKLLCATSCKDTENDVDISGAAVLANEDGVTVQVAFGMENEYKCELEAWGSTGTLRHERILTAPAGFVPTCTIKRGQEVETITLSEDDTFLSSIQYFAKCIADETTRAESRNAIVRQAEFVDEFRRMTNLKGM
ncbi:MAG: Gfo/Idh/MocA family oxidoreductase [Roseburia sp.]|nr:Gfo/Idh/MocA family oxidoreductase [Roseburia sp.]